jgi:hypothetical protein
VRRPGRVPRSPYPGEQQQLVHVCVLPHMETREHDEDVREYEQPNGRERDSPRHSRAFQLCAHHYRRRQRTAQQEQAVQSRPDGVQAVINHELLKRPEVQREYGQRRLSSAPLETTSQAAPVPTMFGRCCSTHSARWRYVQEYLAIATLTLQTPAQSSTNRTLPTRAQRRPSTTTKHCH